MKEYAAKKSKFINLRTDFGFKKLFFEDPNKDLLIDFLNALFKGREVIKDLTYNKTEFPGDITTEGSVIFDLACTGWIGSVFLELWFLAILFSIHSRILIYTHQILIETLPILIDRIPIAS